MSVLMTAGNVAQVTIACTAFNQVGLNDVYFVVNSIAGAGSTDADLAAFLDNLLAPLYKPALTGPANYYGVKVRVIAPTATAIPQTGTTHGGPGTAGTQPLPTQVRGLIRFGTNTIGKPGHGRIFIPFPDVAHQGLVTSTPTAAYLILLNAIANALTLGFTVTSGANSSTYNQVIWHRKTKTYTPVTLYDASAFWATQRRSGDLGRLNTSQPF
jgi:hypothetical protein